VTAAIALAATTGHAATMERESFLLLCRKLWDLYDIVLGARTPQPVAEPKAPQPTNAAFRQREMKLEDFEKAADIASEIGKGLKSYDGKADPWHVYVATQIVAASFAKALHVVDGSHLRLAAQTFGMATDSMAAAKKADLN
jgi:hypothetical protein